MIAIGIDIGGMSIKGAAVDSNGRVYEKFSMPFIKGEPGEVTIRKLAEIVKEYIAANGLENKIAGIGLGSPGTLDVEHGIVNYANNLGWENLHVADIFHEILPYPVRLTNDANAFAIKPPEEKRFISLIPVLQSRLKKKLDKMRSRLPKERINSGFSRTSNFIEYNYCNYDVKKVQSDFEEASKRLAEAQMALDRINTTVEFETDI